MVRPLAIAEPNLDQNFRKSQLSASKSANGVEDPGSDTPTSPPLVYKKTASPPAAPVTKRRKASPALPVSPPSTLTTTTRKLRSSKSPGPQPVKPPSKPASRRGTRSQRTATPPTEPDADDEAPYIEPGGVEEDIEESKKLVEEVKKSYSTPKKPRSTKGQGAPTLKRVVEETQETIPTTFEPKEPEIGEREIIPAPRRFMANLPPQRQAVAWGALAFALGLGATAFLPQFL